MSSGASCIPPQIPSPTPFPIPPISWIPHEIIVHMAANENMILRITFLHKGKTDAGITKKSHHIG
jgi:hypothetical protein